MTQLRGSWDVSLERREGARMTGWTAALIWALQAASAQDDSLGRELRELRERCERVRSADVGADADLFLKGVEWALRYEPPPAPDSASLVRKGLDRARERLDALAAGKHPWTDRKGRVIR